MVYPLSQDELKQIIADKENNIVKVAKVSGRTVGYIASYNLENWLLKHPEWISGADIPEESRTELSSDKTLYGRHIAVEDGTIVKGVGKELLSATLKEASAQGYRHFIAEVLTEPISNDKSARFVQKEGMRIIGQTKDENGRVWTIYQKDLQMEDK